MKYFILNTKDLLYTNTKALFYVMCVKEINKLKINQGFFYSSRWKKTLKSLNLNSNMNVCAHNILNVWTIAIYKLLFLKVL